MSVTVHLISVANIDVAEEIPAIWLLHIGVFIVWIPVVIETSQNKKIQELRKSESSNWKKSAGTYDILFKGAPKWMRVMAMAGFVYAFLNFFLFASSQGGTPNIVDGEYLLQSHGKLIKTLTKEEYHSYKANEARAFSGHWVLFYGVATVALFRFSGLAKQEE